MAVPALDRIDRRLLALLQADNQVPNQTLAEQVGLSAPACSRRVARLHDSGVIRGDVALVDPKALGKTLTAVVTVALDVRRKDRLDAFARRVSALEEVQQCFMVAGATDFIMVVRLDDMDAYSAFAAEALGSDPNVRSYETWFVLAECKNTSRIAVDPD